MTHSLPQKWRLIRLRDISERIKCKNNEDNQNVLTISAQEGLVSQTDFFNKSVSAKNLSGYTLLHKGDFAYNKSYSKGFPTGAIKRLWRYEMGVVSSLYICFRLTKEEAAYIQYYFDCGLQNEAISKIAQEGARNHGLLNIGIKDFFAIQLSLPPTPEQHRIVAILETWDKTIDKLEKKIELKKSARKGLIQKLLTGKIRLPNFDDPWQLTRLQDVLHEHKEKSSGCEEVHSVSVHKGVVNQIEHLGRSFSAVSTDHYNLVKPGDIIYTKSPTGDFPLGIIKQSKLHENVIVSPLYGVFTPETRDLGIMLDAYFESPVNTKNYLNPIVRKGAKNTINITNTTFLSNRLLLPRNRDEQKEIAKIIKMSEEEITILGKKLTHLKQQKCYLLTKLVTGLIRTPENMPLPNP